MDKYSCKSSSECTKELSIACSKLTSCGIPLGNQSVLLKEINDNTETMKSLVHRLLNDESKTILPISV